MKSIKAIVAGIVFIFVASMLMQLAYIFIAVAYNGLAKNYSFLNEISYIFRYLIAIPAFILIMFAGGYLTAVISHHNVIIHSSIVGTIAMAGMMWMALKNAELTTIGVFINLLMVVATTAGGYYWKKRNHKHRVLNIP